MDCGKITSKTVLLFISLIFWATGATLTYVGTYVIKSYNNYDNFLQDKYTMIPAAIIIGVGVVLFIFGLVGCCATIRESEIGLSFFLLFILVIFAVEVATLTLGFIYQNRISGGLTHTMTDIFMKYDGQNSETRAVDYLQTQLHCCGIDTYTNWTQTPWYASHNNTVPLSCCKNTTNPECTGRLDQPDLLNKEGCRLNLDQFLGSVLSYAMLVILGFAIIKFFGMLSVCMITCNQRNGYQRLNGYRA